MTGPIGDIVRDMYSKKNPVFGDLLPGLQKLILLSYFIMGFVCDVLERGTVLTSDRTVSTSLNTEVSICSLVIVVSKVSVEGTTNNPSTNNVHSHCTQIFCHG